MILHAIFLALLSRIFNSNVQGGHKVVLKIDTSVKARIVLLSELKSPSKVHVQIQFFNIIVFLGELRVLAR